ncbi:MAG: hypothetical protein ACR2PK_12735, partial [Acidimicrobiales bacterium]
SKLATLRESWGAVEDPDMQRVLAHSEADLAVLLDRVCELAAESQTRATFDNRLRHAGAAPGTDGMTGQHMQEVGEGALLVWCEGTHLNDSATTSS